MINYENLTPEFIKIRGLFFIKPLPDPAPLAQLDRATDFQSVGQGCESLQARRFMTRDSRQRRAGIFLFCRSIGYTEETA